MEKIRIRNTAVSPNNFRMNNGFSIMREFREMNIYIVAAYLQYRIIIMAQVYMW